MKKALLAAGIVGLYSTVLLAQPTGNQALYCQPVDCPGCPPGQWAQATMPNPAEVSNKKLLTGKSPAVAVLKFDATTNLLYKWDGSTCTTVSKLAMLSAGTPTSPLGGAFCTDGVANNCFCINPSEPTGYFAIMGQPGGFQIVGGPNATVPGALNAPGSGGSLDGTNLFVAPACATGVSDAKALMDAIGFPNVLEVQKYISSNNSLSIYTGRKSSPGPNFAVQPATAYYVKMQTTTDYLPAGCTAPATPTACPGGERLFGVDGTANTNTFVWEIKDGSGGHLCGYPVTTNSPLTNGGNSAVIAKDIVTAVIDPANNCDPAKLTAYTGTNSPYFNVIGIGATYNANSPLQLWLQKPDLTFCNVLSGSPCAFNPTVFDVTGPGGGGGSSVPTLSQWAMLHLVLLLLAMGTLLQAAPVRSAAGPGLVVLGNSRRIVLQFDLLLKTTLATMAIAVVGLGVAALVSDAIPLRDWIGTGITAMLTGYVLHLWVLLYRRDRS